MSAILDLLSLLPGPAYRPGWRRFCYAVQVTAAQLFLPKPLMSNSLHIACDQNRAQSKERPGKDAVPRILFIDDEPEICDVINEFLELSGYHVCTATKSMEGLNSAINGDFDVVITDLVMPGIGGLEVIKTLHETKPLLPVIVMIGHHTSEAAIEAIQFGAYDYILKPAVPDELLALIRKAIAAGKPESLRPEPVEGAFPRESIIGSSRVMQDVCKEIGRIVELPVTVLIRGETGTGKELVAHVIHQHSERARGPFVEVDCARLPEASLQSELLGHERGAFPGADCRRIGRFEQANHGTLFLDEVGELNPRAQTELLDILQQRTIKRCGGDEIIPIDVRVIAVTQENLELAIREGRFSGDLYQLLSEAIINILPLRNHPEDIPDLVRMLVRRCAAEFGVPATLPTEEAMAWLQEQPWPGNVRELRNVIRKALLIARGHLITREMLTGFGSGIAA